MAEKRMFAKQIVLSDFFLDMPMSARCLYFTLGMLADDDGFIGNPKSIMRQCGCTADDMNVLISKRFVIAFDNGVIVIKHWRINNFLRNDRHQTTTYTKELSALSVDENGAYTEKTDDLVYQVTTNGIPSDNQMTANGCQVVYPDKYSIDKSSIDKNSIVKSKRFIPPTLDEVSSYCKERKNNVSPERFIDYYTSVGWMIGKTKMSDWKAAIRTWERNERGNKSLSGNCEGNSSEGSGRFNVPSDF